MASLENCVDRLPDFVVIGASKSGTTSLDYYLSLHPDIHVARPKEPRFFVDRPENAGRWSRGLEWYKSLFSSRKKMCGEVSPQYAGHGEQNGVPMRMFSIIPKAKLIYLVREPYGRYISHYQMLYRAAMTDLPFFEFVAKDQTAFRSSCYGSRLREFLDYFPREQVLVVESAELRDQRKKCLAGIFSFLGVDAQFWSSEFTHTRHVASESICPNAHGRAILRSKPVGFLRRRLSDWTFYHLRNVLMLPFRGPEPPVDLPETLEREIRDRLRSEVALLRNLTDQTFCSLEFHPR